MVNIFNVVKIYFYKKKLYPNYKKQLELYNDAVKKYHKL